MRLNSNYPKSIDLEYTSHARRAQMDETLGLIKYPPLKFMRLYTKHEVQENGTVKATYRFDNKKNLVLIINPETGIVITNWLNIK